MNGTTPSRARAFAGSLLALAFVWSLVLSVSPRLHEKIHPDANRADHSCAVTLVASGSYEHAAQLSVVSAPALAPGFSKLPALTEEFVQSAFLLASIFEHAPPANS